MSLEYPVTLNALQKELIEHSKKGRSDAGFRLNIALAQFGHLAAHFTHDKEENPTARPYNTKDGEVSDAGHAIVQLMTYCVLRNIDLQDAVNKALDNLRANDFVAKEISTKEDISGVVACRGHGPVTGFAFVDQYCLNLNKMPHGCILVANHPNCNISQHQHKLAGLITDHGSFGCHAGIIAREYGIACIVGAGNATERIKTGSVVTIDVESGKITR